MFDEEKTTQSAAPFAFELVGVRGPLTGQRFPLGLDTVTLGRTPDNLVQLQSARASRKHCEIRVQAGQIVLIDLNSSNGTYLNAQRVATQTLQPGDEISIGDEAYVVVRPGQAPAAARATAGPVASAPAMPAPAAPLPPQAPPSGGLFAAPAGPPNFGAPPGPPAGGGQPLFGAPPGPSPYPPPAAPPPPPASLPIPSFLGVMTAPKPFGGPPPAAKVSQGFVDEKTEPPPAMPGFMPDFNAPAAAPTGFAPVQPANYGAPPGPAGSYGAPPGPPPGPAGNYGAPPGPAGNFGGPPGGFAPVAAPPPAPAGPGPRMVNCPTCQRAIDARYSHCPYDATELPKSAW